FGIRALLDRLDPELDLERAIDELPQRPAVARIPHAERRAFPAARLAQGAKAVLVDDMAREAAGAQAGLALGWRRHVDLAVGLLEGLDDPEAVQAPAPCQHLRRLRLHRMPELDARGRREIASLSRWERRKPRLAAEPDSPLPPG